MKPLQTPTESTFRKSNRLLKEAEFEAVLKRGDAFRRSPFRIFYLKKEHAPSRLGLWISKRDFKRAVDRNRLKRRVREFFRRKNKAFLFPCDLIVQIGGKFNLGLDLKQERNEPSFLEDIFQEAGLLKK